MRFFGVHEHDVPGLRDRPLPFFAFNWWFTFVEPVFTLVGLLDAVGNVLMLGLCVVGWRKANAVEAAALPRHRSQHM